MIIIPNKRNRQINNDSNKKRYNRYDSNDLYRKFKVPFDKILDKDFDEGGSYNKKTYVDVDNGLVGKINEYLDSTVHKIVPLLGYTGIGKTHLMVNTIEKYYSIEKLKKSNVMIIPVEDNVCDLVYLCTHERNISSINENLIELLVSRIESICNAICEKWNLNIKCTDEYTDERIVTYIKQTKDEINYWTKDSKKFGIFASMLKYLFKECDLPIRNFVFIYDDLESINVSAQSLLVNDFLKFFECLRSAESKVKLKFFFCLRISTYHHITTMPGNAGIDTHRIDRPMILFSVPAMREVFKKRFDFLIDMYSVDQDVNNKISWDNAYSILIKVAERIDHIQNKLLFLVNNYNISEGLDSFTQILSNRFWTQGNKERRANFIITEGDYYISSAIIYKVLCMGENNVFINGSIDFFPSIFYAGGKIEDDFVNLYLLLLFNNKYNDFEDNNNFSQLSISLENINNIFKILFYKDIFNSDWDHTRNKIKTIFNYLLESKMIRIDDFPRDKSHEPSNNLYYLRPRGNAFFEGFLNSSILFEIYRDAFRLDDSIYDVRCSYQLNQEEIFSEHFKYITEFWKYEKVKLDNIMGDKEYANEYQLYFGDNCITISMLNGIYNNINSYYSSDNMPNLISELLTRIKNKLSSMEKYMLKNYI